MLLFDLFLIIFIIAVVVGIVGSDFGVGFFGQGIAILSGAILLIMLALIADASIENQSYKAAWTEQRKIIVYELEEKEYENDNNLGYIEIMNQVKEWNEDLAAKQTRNHNIWISAFTPDCVDEFELINISQY